MTSSAEPVDLLAGVPEGKDVGLGAVATSTRAKGVLVKNMIEQIQEHLTETEVHGKIRNFYVPPTWHEVFAGAKIPDHDKKWFVESVEFFNSIVSGYKDGSFDPTEVEKDILRLSAQLIFFSSWVNYMDSCATRAEGDRKQAEHRALMEIRSWADEHGISTRALGVDIMKASAAQATQDLRDFDDTFRIVSATIKGFYYSLKSFLEYLDRLSQRAQHERWEAKKHGDAGRVEAPPPPTPQITGGHAIVPTDPTQLAGEVPLPAVT